MKQQIFMKLSQILQIHKNHNFLNMIKDWLIISYTFYGRGNFFIFTSCELLKSVISFCNKWCWQGEEEILFLKR